MNSGFTYLMPWYAVDEPAICVGLEKEIGLELSHEHILYGLAAKLIARRDDCDDALFVLADGRIAEVHLTWTQKRETDTRFPVTAVYASLAEWAQLSMSPLHHELENR